MRPCRSGSPTRSSWPWCRPIGARRAARHVRRGRGSPRTDAACPAPSSRKPPGKPPRPRWQPRHDRAAAHRPTSPRRRSLPGRRRRRPPCRRRSPPPAIAGRMALAGPMSDAAPPVIGEAPPGPADPAVHSPKPHSRCGGARATGQGARSRPSLRGAQLWPPPRLRRVGAVQPALAVLTAAAFSRAACVRRGPAPPGAARTGRGCP